MERSVEGLLDPSPRAGKGGDNAAVVPCTSVASSNFVSAAVLDISRKAMAVKETVNCINRGYRRNFQHTHFIPIVGVGKRGAYKLVHGDLPR